MYQRCTLFLVHPHHQPSAASASSPPTHSAGEAPGMDRLIPGAVFLLARSSPPLAFFCGVRGTLPESRSVQARSLTGAYLPTLRTNALLSFASLLPNQHPAADTPQTQKPSRQITPSGRFSLISPTIKPVLFLLTQQALQSPLRR